MSSDANAPRLIPVLDVMGGRVVRAVGGRRDEYRPVRSRLAPMSDPVKVARALLDAAHADELYVADLDAIAGEFDVSPAVRTLLHAVPVRTWIDVGISLRKDRRVLPPLSNLGVVLGSETMPRREVVSENVSVPGDPTPVGFSLDLRHGELLGDWQGWGLRDSRDVYGLAKQVMQSKIEALFVIDVGRVGTGRGTDTVELCRRLREAYPNVRLIAGGGVRTRDDVQQLGDAGVDAILVASALHDGTL